MVTVIVTVAVTVVVTVIVTIVVTESNSSSNSSCNSRSNSSSNSKTIAIAAYTQSCDFLTSFSKMIYCHIPIYHYFNFLHFSIIFVDKP